VPEIDSTHTIPEDPIDFFHRFERTGEQTDDRTDEVAMHGSSRYFYRALKFFLGMAQNAARGDRSHKDLVWNNTLRRPMFQGKLLDRPVPGQIPRDLPHKYGRKPWVFISRRYTDVVAVM